jgi:hypothetical protein
MLSRPGPSPPVGGCGGSRELGTVCVAVAEEVGIACTIPRDGRGHAERKCRRAARRAWRGDRSASLSARERSSRRVAPRNLVPTFPQSPPLLLTTAACGGLRSTPDCRPRRTYLHLSYSYVPPFGPAILVTQDPSATWARCSAAAVSVAPRVGSRARSFSRLFGVLTHPFAHEVDMISQHVEHARIGDGHSEVVCLLLEAVEPRDHLAHVAPAVAGVCYFVLQEPQLPVHAQNFRSHRPVIETRQKSHHRVEHAQDRNEQDDELAEQRARRRGAAVPLARPRSSS